MHSAQEEEKKRLTKATGCKEVCSSTFAMKVYLWATPDRLGTASDCHGYGPNREAAGLAQNESILNSGQHSLWLKTFEMSEARRKVFYVPQVTVPLQAVPPLSHLRSIRHSLPTRREDYHLHRVQLHTSFLRNATGVGAVQVPADIHQASVFVPKPTQGPRKVGIPAIYSPLG